MAHFAELNENNVVVRVIVVDDAHEADGENWCRKFFGSGNWKQTSYNTVGGVHSNGGVAFRKNYAGVGFTYDPASDAFIPLQPFNSWILDEDTFLWGPPVPYPDDGNIYSWNESTQSWDIQSN